MEHQNSRIIVYPADIQRLYGLEEKAAYRKYRKIKLAVGLGRENPLTTFHLSRHLRVLLKELEEKLFPSPIHKVILPTACS